MSTTRPRHTIIGVLLVAAMVSTGGLSCIPAEHTNPGFDINNHRTEAITIQVLGLTQDLEVRTETSGQPSDEPPYKITVPARTYQQVFGADQCNGLGAMATDVSGAELARLDQPLCWGNVWVFEENGSIHLDRTV